MATSAPRYHIFTEKELKKDLKELIELHKRCIKSYLVSKDVRYKTRKKFERLYDYYINNSNIRTLTNLSNAPSAAVVNVGIAYRADLQKAETVIRAVCEKLPEMYPDLFPQAPRYMGVEKLNESSVDLRVIADVQEEKIYNARRALNRELKLALDEAGIEIPFPQMVVWQKK